MADVSGYEVRLDGKALLRFDSEAEALAANPSDGAVIVRRFDGRRLYQRADGNWIFCGHDAQLPWPSSVRA